MFVFNIKLNLKLIAKIVLISMGIIVLTIFAFSIYRNIRNNFEVRDSIDEPDIAYIDSKNYTNILKNIYENINQYIGQKVCSVGYIYRQTDFGENEFVLARDMQSTNENQAYIVGFLCNCKEANQFEDGTWIKVVAEITEGEYHGVIPILKILQIEKVEKPVDSVVPPPNNTYIPTSYIY